MAALIGIDPAHVLKASDPVEQMMIEAVIERACQIREDAIKAASRG